MPVARVMFPSNGIVDEQGNPNEKSYTYSSEHDRIHRSISFLFRLRDERSDKGDEKARNSYYPHPLGTFLEEETDKARSQDDLSKVCEHSRQPNSLFRTQHLFCHKQSRLYHGFIALAMLVTLVLAQPAEGALIVHVVIPAEAGIDNNDAADAAGSNNSYQNRGVVVPMSKVSR